MKTCCTRMSWLCVVGLAWLVVGCYVSTPLKEDAINLEGLYEVKSTEKVFSEPLLAVGDKITMENETGFFDVQMIWERKAVPEWERRLIWGVRVTSERDYLLKRVLLGAGYLEPDTVLSTESRENLSFDGGKTGEVTVASRFFRLKEAEYSAAFLANVDTSTVTCGISDVKMEAGKATATYISHPAGTAKAQACVTDLKQNKIEHQAFRYTFEGKAESASSRLEGTLALWVRTNYQMPDPSIKVSVNTRIWAQKIVLQNTTPPSQPSSN